KRFEQHRHEDADPRNKKNTPQKETYQLQFLTRACTGQKYRFGNSLHLSDKIGRLVRLDPKRRQRKKGLKWYDNAHVNRKGIPDVRLDTEKTQSKMDGQTGQP